jgi:hypothetical protein
MVLGKRKYIEEPEMDRAGGPGWIVSHRKGKKHPDQFISIHTINPGTEVDGGE